jgi:hypothetical protein
MWEVGLPPSPVEFPPIPLPLFQAFRLLVAGRVLPLLPFSGWLVYLQFCEGLPLPPLCYVSFVVVVVYSVCFFLFCLGGGSVCPGGKADLAQGCLWEYLVLLSSPGRLFS